MKEFLRLLRRFVPPYKKYLIGALFLNLLSAILNIFSFALIIPILQILFKMDTKTYEFIPWDAVGVNLKDIAVNNFYYYVTELIASQGGSLTLLILGVFLAVMTLLKAFSYFASSAVMIPLRTGVVRDIRAQVYNKVLHLPLSFFSEERKGDIIARMSGDVTEVETSVTSSLDMLIKNPILIIAYFGTLIAISWQLTLFTLLVLPGMGWIMGTVGKKLKRQSLDAQAKWSDTMSQLEETLGGLRIIKAFIAENKMMERFNKCSNEYRDAINRVATRQALAHPMSEFLGTCVIVIVLWFGGTLILSNSSTIDAPSFIYYLVILYSVINPLKEFSKAGYNIPKGLASMERIDKILFAENPIKEPARPKPLSSLKDKVEFKDISFSYDGSRQVLKHINLTVPKGKTIALVGQSGSGKSTLLNIIGGIDSADSGYISINGDKLEELGEKKLTQYRRKHLGYVFQMYNLIANLNVKENIEAGAYLSDSPLDIDDLLHTLGLYEHRHKLPNQLSGGQQQRVSIGRAIVKNPDILLCDEPTGALDYNTSKEILKLIEDVNVKYGNTVIMVTHNEAIRHMADHVIKLRDGAVRHNDINEHKISAADLEW